MVISNESLTRSKENLKATLSCCQNFTRTMLAVPSEKKKILEWFQELCRLLTEAIDQIGDYNKVSKLSEPIQSTFLLFLTQLLTSLSLLINMFTNEEEIDQRLQQIRGCVTKQIVYCLEGIDTVITTNQQSFEDISGSFVKWMDSSLGIISEITNNSQVNDEFYTEARECVEEVLSHAMSIAQVSLEEDSKIIRGSSQTVLSVLASLTTQIDTKPYNGAMVKLFADSCCDKLCHLERKVNTGVLRLCLRVFAFYSQPLDDLAAFCFNSKNKGKVHEMENLIVDFDLHVDRIMQIGLFSVACSNDSKKGVKIRSCLASLEALESELVPSLTAALIENTRCNKICAKILMEHWINQANSLQQLIFLIIDPLAFSKIIYDEAAEIVEKLSVNLKKNNCITEQTVDTLVTIATVLRSFLKKAQAELAGDEIDKLIPKINDFHNVLDEVKSAAKSLLSKETNKYDNSSRVLKRCKILLTVIKRLWYCFLDNPITKNSFDNDSLNLTTSDLANLDISNKTNELLGNGFFDHIIKRSQEILEERTVLYRTATPKKSDRANGANFSRQCRTDFVSKKAPLPLARLVKMRNIHFANASTRSGNFFDLNIEGILGEITGLSSTFQA